MGNPSNRSSITPSRSAPRVGLVTTSSAELEHLAQFLDKNGLLDFYIHPYLTNNRPWERGLMQLPGISDRLSQTFRRRTPPPDLDPTKVKSAAIGEEFLGALLLNLPLGRLGTNLRTRLMHRRNRRLDRLTHEMAERVDILVASHASANSFFSADRPSPIRVLNFPSIHHRTRVAILRQEIADQPQLKRSMEPLIYSEGTMRRYDRECESADSIFVGSSFARSTFIENGIPAERLYIIPYGVDTERFRPAPTPTEQDQMFTVLYVGQIGQSKGISYLLDGYRRFRKGDTELVLVGNYISDVFSRCQDRFRHIRHVPHTELVRYFQCASVFVMPSLYEGMGLTVLEAMACGVPTIVTDRGPNEIVQHGGNGFVIPARNPDAIAHYLELLYRDRSLLKTMGEAARSRAEEFTWDTYTGRAADVLVTLASAGPSGEPSRPTK